MLKPTSKPLRPAETAERAPREEDDVPWFSRSPVLVGFCVLAATVLQLIRQPDFTRGVLWAEDGGIFLSDAYNKDFFTALFQPYGSYLHFAPRTIFAVISLFPVRAASVLTAASAALVVSLLALYVYHASKVVFETQWARLALAVSMVLLPAAGYETNATVINLHWYLIFTAFWVFVAAPRSGRGIALGALIVGFAVMSDPLVGILAPVALLAIVRRRTARSLIIPAVFAAGLIVQLAVGTGQQPLNDPSTNVDVLPSIYALRVAGSVLVGDVFLDNFWRRLGYPFAYGALLAIVAFCGYGFVRGGRATRLLIGGSLLFSFVLLAAPLVVRGTEGFLNRDAFNLNGSRYFLVPILFVTTAILKVVDAQVRHDRTVAAGDRRSWRTVQYVVTIAGAGLMLTNFTAFNVRGGGPFWATSLAQARKECQGAPSRGGRRVRPPASVRVPVAPPVDPPPFAVTLKCERLR
jgi:hypothetical protein